MPKPPHICTCGQIVPHGERCACQVKRTRARNKRHHAKRPCAARRGYNRAWRAARDAFSSSIPPAGCATNRPPWWTISRPTVAMIGCFGIAATGSRSARPVTTATSNGRSVMFDQNMRVQFHREV